MKLDPIDRARIRVESSCDETTIRKYPNVSNASRRRIEGAASKLGIELPPTPTPAPSTAAVRRTG